MTRTNRATLMFAALVLAASCRDTERTSIRVEVRSSDLAPGIDVDTVKISIHTNETVERFIPMGRSAGQSGFPLIFGVTPSDDPNAWVTIRAHAQKSDATLIETGAMVRWRRGEELLLVLDLERACIGVRCENQDYVCQAGACTLPFRRPNLPRWTGVEPDAGAPLTPDAGADATPDASIDGPPPADAAPSCRALCAAGQRRCGANGGLETCVEVEGCGVWGPEVACAGGLPCAGAAPHASCLACPAAPMGCPFAGKVCRGNDLVGCETGADQCLQELAPISCAHGCKGAHPIARCCPAPPPGCTEPGSICRNGKLVTCTKDAAGCLLADEGVTCAGPCKAGPSGAVCCPAPPPGCTDQGNACRGNDVDRCTKDENGCLKAARQTCPAGKACAGTYPNAQCTCASPPVCTESTCNGDTLLACELDDKQCFTLSERKCDPLQFCGGVPAACRPMATYGYATAFPRSQPFFAGQRGFAFVLTRPLELRRLGLIVTKAGTKGTEAYLSVVASGGSEPSPDPTSVWHWQPVPVDTVGIQEVENPAPFTLPPGQHWLILETVEPSDFEVGVDYNAPRISFWQHGVLDEFPPINIFLRGAPQ